MANRVFISFRFSDGEECKKELAGLFNGNDDVINCSEDEDRSNLSEETIQKYLYKKLSQTSVTIVLLTPKAVEHQKNYLGKYDDWMHDEIRYSLENRDNNNPNGLIAVYTPETRDFIIAKNTCINCDKKCGTTCIKTFDNLVRENMMNVKDEYKTHPCEGIYDTDWDSYCSLMSLEDFKKNYVDYIDKADKKRNSIYKYDIKKNLNMK